MRYLCKFIVLAAVLGLMVFSCTEPPEPLQAPTPLPSGLMKSAMEGKETLGIPNITIASGTHVFVDGVGLRFAQPGTITIPAMPGATVEQVLLYWEGFNTTATGDDQVLVNGTNTVTGDQLNSTATLFFTSDGGAGDENWSVAYRADITSLGLVTAAGASITVEGYDVNRPNGAGILVIYDDGTANVVAGVRDGDDCAYHAFPPTLDTTVPQTFSFLPATVTRTANLHLMAGSVQADRPNTVMVTFDVGSPVEIADPFDGISDGDDFDAVTETVTVPAGATEMTVQCLSQEATGGITGNPASMVWICAAVDIPIQLAAIGDYVWFDDDQDGCQDDTEDPVTPGVTVNLYDCNIPTSPVFVATQTTGTGTLADGEYFFDDLIPGDYLVEFILPTGFLFTQQDQACVPGGDANDSDANPTTGRTICTTLDPGEIDRTWDAGIYKTGGKGDFVWIDGDCDGCQDTGEVGLDGVTVMLYDCSNPSSPVLLGTQTTGPPRAQGGYLFEDLPPGDYYVQFVLPTGYAFTTPNDCPAGDEQDSDADPATGRTVCAHLDRGQIDLSWDAGLIELLKIGDFVWFDDDNNGCQDDGEAGVPNVTVHLWQSGSLLDTEVTDAAGIYTFEGLMPGSYTVQFVLPTELADYEFTLKDQACVPGGDEKDSDADLNTGFTDVIELVCGQDDMTVDAGIYKPVDIGCRMTGGCNDTYDTGEGTEVYTCGGQAGAPLASQPQPWGEWTHTQKRGPSGDFTFHAGTASAPPETEIDWIVCMDEGWCRQARPAPAKQLDFAGVGTFKNMKPNVPPEISDYVIVGESLHWFEVNVDDLGEPGKGGKVDPPPDPCDELGFGRNGGTELADCQCPDFYRIRIYQGQTDSSPIMYEVFGYIDGGNFQIHPPTGRDRKNFEDDRGGKGKGGKGK